MALDGTGQPGILARRPYYGCSFVRTAGTAAHVSGGTEVSPRGHQRACTGKRPVSRGEARSASKQLRWWGSIRFRCASSHAASPGCFIAPPLSHTHTHLSSLVKGGEIGQGDDDNKGGGSLLVTPSIQYKLWVSLVWKHNNGEHCWLGNGPEDDHWHPPLRG